jgi:DNA repair photolyase
MKPIYIPKGKAKEYGDYAINIYTGCPHECYYCFAPNVLHKVKDDFHKCIEPRKNIVEEVRKQIYREKITGKLIHLCFTCDPYPKGYDSTPTREIIKVLKESGNHVQILTKNGIGAARDFDLLDSNDWFGITYAGYENGEFRKEPKSEPNADSPHGRLLALYEAHERGIKTWVSAEPVLNDEDVLLLIKNAWYVDLWKVGKLNYYPSDIDWGGFGRRAESALISIGKAYYIKESLRAEMEGGMK